MMKYEVRYSLRKSPVALSWVDMEVEAESVRGALEAVAEARGIAGAGAGYLLSNPHIEDLRVRPAPDQRTVKQTGGSAPQV